MGCTVEYKVKPQKYLVRHDRRKDSLVKKSRTKAQTLTEAQARSGTLFILFDHERTSSNYRHIPYAEEYRAVTGVTESPLDRLQQAAWDERQRRVESTPPA